MGFGIKELVVVLIIVLLLFGTKKLKSIGTDLGGAIKGFRKSVVDDTENSLAEPEQEEAEVEHKEANDETVDASAQKSEKQS